MEEKKKKQFFPQRYARMCTTWKNVPSGALYSSRREPGRLPFETRPSMTLCVCLLFFGTIRNDAVPARTNIHHPPFRLCLIFRAAHCVFFWFGFVPKCHLLFSLLKLNVESSQGHRKVMLRSVFSSGSRTRRKNLLRLKGCCCCCCCSSFFFEKKNSHALDDQVACCGTHHARTRP